MKFYLTCLSFVFIFGMHAQNVEVCPTCPLNTIKKGVEAVDSGGTVFVRKGVYQEVDIQVKKPMTLRAEPGVIIDGQNQGEVLIAQADNFTIDGFEIINIGTSFLRDHSAVRVKDSKNFLVQNLIIRKPFWAIYIERSNDGIVRDNLIEGQAKTEFNSGNGIQLWHSKNNLIENNKISRMRDAIYFEFSDNNDIKGNKAENNVRYGLHFMFCHDNIVEYNHFKSSGAGIAIMFSKRMDAHHNVFEGNWGGAGYGMLLKEVFDTKLTNNLFKSNTTAINLEGATRITYEYNTFQSNGWAINSRGANYDNVFVNNNFVNNSFNLSYNGPINRNSFNGNYWSDYSGYDLDRDGYGDVPYRPIKLFSYVVNRSPEAIILLRSLFIDILDFSEKVSPVFTPDNVMDERPSMKMLKYD